MSAAAILGIVVGDVAVLGLLLALVFCYFYRHLRGKKGTVGKAVGRQLVESEKIVYSNNNNDDKEGGFERGKMVFFEGGKRFELEDLLRASAEMLGKGGFGTAYKAVLDDGNVVAVKRLKELNGGTGSGGKREFEQVMETLGRLRHPNVVSLKAYYFARDERLLVFDYMPNGSLFWLLHGNRGPGRIPLDWTSRMKIASGVAHGLAYIHHFCVNRTTNKLWHGNIKSTNVLLDKIYNPRLSDWGLNTLFASSPTTTKTAARPPNGYRAPEALESRKYSHQKADVYAFGVLLLEILTGKCPLVVDSNGISSGGAVLDLPRWVQSVVREEWTAEVFDLELMRYKDIEEEMVGLLQIAMACTCVSPDQRPRIGSVLRMIEEIRGVEVSPSYESFDSDSPSVSEYTDG
ncbi:hypothetical protein Sjap_014895 [Stephania japonica]|uniref:Protein kinase domain-containing protein n=1 Tax=Stephania japonica TaxID=461633 RepID=A0AAP0II86_9MAGN